jgi:YihY family inner membrane protein
VRKFSDDRASSLAALVAYYAFFSAFPLALVLVSVLGFVLEDDPSLRTEIVDTAFGRLPVIGAQLGNDVEPLTGSALALLVGLAGALWAGLGVTLALGRAFDDIWDVPQLDRRNPVQARVRGLLMLVIFGVSLVASTALAGIAVGGVIGPVAQRLGAVLISLAVNAVVVLASFALLTARPVHVRELLPGVALAGIGLFALQSLGSWYVNQAVTRASDTYGTFALVIGLLSWFLLIAYLILLAAELNVVLHRRLWPRSLSGPLEPADREALSRLAQAAQRDPRERISVDFDAPP